MWNPPGIWVTKHKSGNYQKNKTNCQWNMLYPFVNRHSKVEGMSIWFMNHHSSLLHFFNFRFSEKIQKVMNEHTTDCHRNKNYIHSGNCINNRFTLILSCNVDLSNGKILICTGMTTSAGLNKVGFIYTWSRVWRRFDVMSSMTTRTICHFNRSTSNCKPMITIGKCIEPVCGDAIFVW